MDFVPILMIFDCYVTIIIQFTRFTRHAGRSPFGKVDYYSTDLIITNLYIPPSKLMPRRIQSISGSSDQSTDSLILGDFNTHHSSWYSSSTDSRGTMLESMVSGSSFGILNWDSPTRLPGNANPSSPDVSLALASLITSTNWQTKTNLISDHLPILISLQIASLSTRYNMVPASTWKRKAGTDKVKRLKTS